MARSVLAASVPILGCLMLAACSAAPDAPQSDEDKLVQATLGLLSGRGEPLCVDAKTFGRPLSVFRTMADNPPVGASPPAWFLPAQFSPPTSLSGKDLYRSSLSDGVVHIDQPTNDTPAVAPQVQKVLDNIALALSSIDADRPVTISPSWQPGIKARWWLRNRISNHCSPNFRISNPIATRKIGFVTVMGDHWGTTYAFKREGANWAAIAQWSNWLY